VEDLTGVNITPVNSTERLLEFLRWLGNKRDALAIDTETGGFIWYREPLRLVQLADRDSAWCFAWDDWRGLLKDVLPRYQGDFVFHNAKFDIHYLHQNGVEWSADMWRRSHDTMLMAHLIQPDEAVGLKPLARKLIHPGAAAASEVLDNAMHKQGWNWGTVPVDFPYYWGYGGLDTILTARLYNVLRNIGHSTPLALYELERRVLYTVYKMECRGAHIDVNFCITKSAELEAFIMQSRDWAKANYGIANLTSDKQVIDKLIADGVELTKMTDSGNSFSLDAEVLQWVQHPLAQVVLKARQATKIKNTYLRTFIEMNDGGVYHADLRTLGTRTGRMTGGILQTLTRGKGPVRDSFTSRYEGGKMIMVDYDQIEMRLMAILSGDEALAAACMGPDLFTTMTRLVYNEPDMPKSDPRRQTFKNGRYARAYGAGLEKIALTNGLTMEQVREMEAGWTANYPKAANFSRVVENVAKQRLEQEGVAYVRTPLGRYEPAKNANERYQLPNYLMQGTAADVFKQGLVRCDEAGLDEYMVLPVHDEAVLDAPGELAEEVARTAQKAMEDTSMSVALTTGADIVDRWGDKYL
jgi:DNA polymerase-1